MEDKSTNGLKSDMRPDPLVEEITVNSPSSPIFIQDATHHTKPNLENTIKTTEEERNLETLSNACNEEDNTNSAKEIASSSIDIQNSNNMQIIVTWEEMTWAIEEVEPLNIQNQEVEKDPELDTLIWSHRNIIRLSKEFGVGFEGCEKEALQLFMKIDHKRQTNKGDS